MITGNEVCSESVSQAEALLLKINYSRQYHCYGWFWFYIYRTKSVSIYGYEWLYLSKNYQIILSDK